MTTVTLYEAPDGSLYLHLEGALTLWRMNLLAASTFLTDALLVANQDTAAHPEIFSNPTTWQDLSIRSPAELSDEEPTLYPIAILRLDPDMGLAGAAYTLFKAG